MQVCHKLLCADEILFACDDIGCGQRGADGVFDLIIDGQAAERGTEPFAVWRVLTTIQEAEAHQALGNASADKDGVHLVADVGTALYKGLLFGEQGPVGSNEIQPNLFGICGYLLKLLAKVQIVAVQLRAGQGKQAVLRKAEPVRGGENVKIACAEIITQETVWCIKENQRVGFRFENMSGLHKYVRKDLG